MGRYEVKDVISEWLEQNTPSPQPFEKFMLIEIQERIPQNEEIRSHLSRLLVDSRADISLLEASAKRLGWKMARDIVTSGLPTLPKMRKGFFGETLENALLKVFGYVIPIQKLRFLITANQSLPGTDTIAIRISDDEISRVLFVESKLRTHTDTKAATQGYGQLKNDYAKKIPDMLRFMLARLYERSDPLLNDFLRYLRDRKDLTKIERFVIGLIWDHDAWTNTVLRNLQDEVEDNDVPELIVHRVRIKNLPQLIENVFKTTGFGC